MGNLHDYAVKEMDIAWPEPDPMQDAIKKDILEIVDTFSAQGHSGVSAPYCIAILERLLRYKPITPLTGEDDEWDKPYGKNNTQQNKRCSSIFRENFDNSTAHDIHGKVFSDDGGKAFYSTRDSQIPIEFPYYPQTSAKRVILKNKKEDVEE